MSPIAERIIDRLDAARQKWWLFSLLTTTVLAAAASSALLFIFAVLDALLVFSQAVLAGLFAFWLAATLAMAVLVLRRIFANQRTLEAAARRVEAEFPELGSSLINLVQLADDDAPGDAEFRAAAVRQSLANIGDVRFERAAVRQNRLRRFLYRMQTPRDLTESLLLAACLILAALVCQALLPNWASAANRLLAPWKFVPTIGAVGPIEVSPGDAAVQIGGSLEISGRIANPDKKTYKAVLHMTATAAGADSAQAATTELPLTADADNRTFKTTLASVLGPFAYRLEIGDSQSGEFQVSVREKPAVAEVEITYNYPKYLDRSPQTVKNKLPDLQAPQYTVAELKIRPSQPIAAGYVMQSGRRLAAQVEDGGSLLVVKRLAMIENGSFTIHLEDDAGLGDSDPRVNRISITPDRPPKARLLKPSLQSNAAPGDKIEVIAAGEDDHGLGAVKLQTRLKPSAEEESESPVVTVKEWNDLGGAKNVSLKHTLALDGKGIEPGSVLLVRAVSADRREIDISQWGLNLKPQETAGPWHALRIVAREEKIGESLQKLESLRTAVFQILEKQIRARLAAAEFSKSQQTVTLEKTAAVIRVRQIDIQKTASALAESISLDGDEERRATRRTLDALAAGLMLDAVRVCDAMQKLRDRAEFAPAAAELTGAQDKIISALRELLDLARRAESAKLDELNKRSGGDLPDDVKKKLEAARDKLAEFLKQQKKIIEATENLAKTPVDDFSEEQEQLLKKLAAAEDDWANFLKDFHSDMSKLAEQEFSNPSLLKELVEIQTEIKMAADALTKKTADIAVPLEQLGYEMAEEILTNMEKWLPDTPDRERWSQEESPSDADKEAPMAELPGELEDLIGELMEEEEDLFDEMEDMSSSAADSLDKGAGWDAVDGPISNMSAKGVTGNRLPNTSEMSGRAGEGRSGKSSGEFVGDEAVGKGGRKTPSRLTADPYEKGQIKDHSRDPVGGATGGGKESGQGGEGLEGPQRRSPGAREMQRLAGRQAALRNKAESIDVQMKIMNFHRTDLQKMIEAMAQVERDVAAGRYKNALRQRKVLADGLSGVKQYVEGEFHVRGDTTANLPGDIQKEILGGAADPSPAGWEQMNLDYFRRLSGQEK